MKTGRRARSLPPGFAAEAREIRREWPELQRRLAQRSSRGAWRLVAGSDHLIGNSQPHAVATAVLEILAETRAGARAAR